MGQAPRLGSLRPREVLGGLLGRDAGASGRVVPPTGATAGLVVATAASMAFLAVFALALALATGRLAERWSEGLAQSLTIRISAQADKLDEQTRTLMEILRTTPGLGEAKALTDDEMQALLQPWFGPDMPVDALPIPRLVEVPIIGRGPDIDGLELRLEGEAPDAVLDDHTDWRRPLVNAAHRLRLLGWLSLLLIGATAAGMITLAAQASLAANGQVIRVLRLIGAKDITIANAFVRRFTRRAALGAAGGTLAGVLAIAALPRMDVAGSFLTGLGFTGWGWLWPLLIPVLAALIGFVATRRAAIRRLAEAA
ncbi:cell division protein FtsX [Paracoccus suum]|uniref:cell division protein FtsX n=1 Tax=Paracoccus suum TaxID=2259340 RepID=UPI003BB10B07